MTAAGRHMGSGVLLVLLSLVLHAVAGTYGPMTYEVVEAASVTITDCDQAFAGDLEIPAEIEGLPVTAIGDSAFLSCRLITSIGIPESVATIGRSAFGHCNLLGEVALPDGLVEIGENAFSYCRALSSIHLPEGIIVIPPRCFSYCTALEVVECEADLVGLGDYAFSACSALRAVNAAAGVVYAGVEAFRDCSELIGILIADETLGIEARAFAGCRKLVEVVFPTELWILGDGAFSGCHSLSSVTFKGDGVLLGDEVFADCPALESIEVEGESGSLYSIDGVLYRGFHLVRYPSSRQGGFSVPDHVRFLAAGAFDGAAELTSVDLPPGLEGIGVRAFRNCHSLTELALPPSLTTLNEEVFLNCSGLRDVRMGDALGEIGDGAFEGCVALRDIRLPPELIRVGDRAFYGCTSLEEVMIPASVTEVGAYAFRGSRSLRVMWFAGDAPVWVGKSIIDLADDFRFVRLSGTTGFEGHDFEVNEEVIIDESVYPAAGWLISHYLPYETDLETATTPDGLPLLFAYAFHLDPDDGPRTRMPRPIREGEWLRLRLEAGCQGYGYRVEASGDGTGWSSDGVWTSVDPETGEWIASVRSVAPRGMIRVVVERVP